MRQKIKQKLLLIKSKISALKSPVSEISLSRNNQKKVDVFIWGCNEFSLYLAHLLTRHNINILGFIQNKPGQSTFCNKHVYAPQDFKEKTEYSNTPIIVASPHGMENNLPRVDFESVRQFKLTISEILKDYQLTNTLLHPCALVDSSNCTYANKIITFGLPGTGNTIYNHIFIKLIEAYENKFKNNNLDTIFFEKMCYEYEQCLKQVVTDTLLSIGGHDILIAPWNVGESMISFTYEHESSAIYKFFTRDHITHRAYGYHNIPSDEVLDNLISQQFKLFLLVRNPLDVILSLLKKRKKINLQTNEIDMNGFHAISQRVVKQFSQLKKYYSKFEILKYENLIENPTQQILNVMKKLNLSPSESIAQSIWDQLGFRQLPHAFKGHFAGGGYGKWEKVFTPEHLGFLSRIGIENTLKEYDYLDTLEIFDKKIKSFSIQKYEQLEFSIPDTSEGELAYIKTLHKNENVVESGCFNLTSNNEMLIKKMQNSLNTDYIEKLVCAGTYPTFVENNQSIQVAI